MNDAEFAGRRNSAEDEKHLQDAHDALCRMGVKCRADNVPSAEFSTGQSPASNALTFSDEALTVERDALLFEAGEYADKGLTVTADDLHRIVAGTASAPIQVGHAEPEFKLGLCDRLRVEGNKLFGKLNLTPVANALLEQVGMKTLSVGIPRDCSRLLEVSVTGTPRVPGAQFFSGVECVTFTMGESAPVTAQKEQTMADDKPKDDAVTAEQFSTVTAALDQERRARLELEARLRRSDAEKELAQFSAKVPPAARDAALSLLTSDDKISFSGEDKPVAGVFRDFLTNLPVVFSAPVKGTATGGKDEEPGKRLETLAKERADKEKVGYSVAFSAVCRENPELAQQYRDSVRMNREGN